MQLRTPYIFNRRAFTLIEMLVVVAIIVILAAMLLPALSRGKDQANKIKCVNNLHQLQMATQMYADDHEDQYPPRRQTPNHWVPRLKEYYISDRIVECPKGHLNEDTPHSYLMNSFSDYFEETLTPAEFELFKAWVWQYGMRVSAIPEPSETILYGEKYAKSTHVHMDFFQGEGNDLTQVDHARHLSGAGSKSGVSDYAFVDGSVRSLGYGKALNPVNLWALVEQYRRQPLAPPDPAP